MSWPVITFTVCSWQTDVICHIKSDFTPKIKSSCIMSLFQNFYSVLKIRIFSTSNYRSFKLLNKIFLSSCFVCSGWFSSLVFWFGDLNFRIDDLDMQVVKSAIDNNKLSVLWEKDQVKKKKVLIYLCFKYSKWWKHLFVLNFFKNH